MLGVCSNIKNPGLIYLKKKVKFTKQLFFFVGNNFNNSKSKREGAVGCGTVRRRVVEKSRPQKLIQTTFYSRQIDLLVKKNTNKKKKRFRDEISFRTLCNNTCTFGNSHTLLTKTASHKLTLQFELPINKQTSNFGLH